MTTLRTRSSSAAAAAAAAAQPSSVIPPTSNLIDRATLFVKSNRHSATIRRLKCPQQRTDGLIAQALLLQQMGSSQKCPTCGVGVSLHGTKCSACKRLSHIFCSSTPLCDLCSQTTTPMGNRLLDTFVATAAAYSYAETFDLVELFIEAAPSRRRLRVLNGKGRPSGHATSFISLVRSLLRIAHHNSSAELLLFFLPRVAAIKGLPLEESLNTFVNRERPSPRETRPLRPQTAWRCAIDCAVETHKLRTLCTRLDQGPSDDMTPSIPDNLDSLFPPITSHDVNECDAWDDILTDTPTTPRFSPADLRRWATSNPNSSGAECGWTGHLILLLFHGDREVFNLFSQWASRPPHLWTDSRTGLIASRSLTGWFIPSRDSLRPISAPSFVRRVGSAALMRRARPLMELFCRRRGQLGLSSEPYQLAYSTLQQTYLADKGTVSLDDRSKSFVTISRTSVRSAFAELLRHATEDDRDAVDAISIALTDYYISDLSADPHQHRARLSTVNFKALHDMKFIYGLAQGCSTSPSIQAVVLAHHTGLPLPQHLNSLPPLLTLACHDDLARSATKTNHHLMTLPSCDAVGGSYNSTKSVHIGEAFPDQRTATIWGRPLGNFTEWFDIKMNGLFQRIQRIRTLANDSIASAIRAAVALGGPRGLLLHALKGTPPDAISNLSVATLEQAWADLIVDLCGPREPPWDQPEVRFRHVFSSPSPFTTSTLETASLAGFSTAISGCSMLLGSSAAEQVIHLLASNYCSRNGTPPTAHDLRSRATFLAERDEKEWQKRPSNLWTLSLAAPTELTLATDALRRRTTTDSDAQDVQDLAAKLALAHAIRYPQRLAAGLSTDPCPRCLPFDNTSANIDDDLHHLQVCKRNTNSTRHDELARQLVLITRTAGVDTEIHDDSIPSLASGKRPADFIEHSIVPAQPEYCIDLTITMPEHLQARCSAKHRVYDPLLRNSRFTLNVFGIALDGTLHDETHDIIRRWTSQFSALRKSCALSQQDARRQLEREIAHSFATAQAAAIRRWKEHISNLARISIPHRRRTHHQPLSQRNTSTPSRIRTRLPLVPQSYLQPPCVHPSHTRSPSAVFPSLNNPPIPHGGAGSATPTPITSHNLARSSVSNNLASVVTRDCYTGKRPRASHKPRQRTPSPRIPSSQSTSPDTPAPVRHWPKHLRARVSASPPNDRLPAVPEFLRPSPQHSSEHELHPPRKRTQISHEEDSQTPNPQDAVPHPTQDAPHQSRGSSCSVHQTTQQTADTPCSHTISLANIHHNNTAHAPQSSTTSSSAPNLNVMTHRHR